MKHLVVLLATALIVQLSVSAQTTEDTEKELQQRYQKELVEVRVVEEGTAGLRVDLPKEMRSFLEGSVPTFARVEKFQLKKKAVETEVRFVLFYRDGKELREALSQRWKLRLKWDDPQLPGNEIMTAVGKILVPAKPDPNTWENYWPPEQESPLPDRATGPRLSREIAPGVYTGGSDMTPPECISCPQPDFPSRAKDHSSGLVVLITVINAEGRLRGVFVKKANPAGYGFEDAAVWAVSRWRFKPAMREGQPVGIFMTIEVDFHRF
jgi:protein TonB